MTEYREFAASVGMLIDAAGVLAILFGAVLATARFALRRQREVGRSYRIYRQDLGKGILLGLEFLVAGDIIRTVAVSPTLDNVLVLGLIVLIRTFLSTALELELEGRWPWHKAESLGSQT